MMSEPKPPDASSRLAAPFPSRRDYHGSRIPLSKGKEEAPAAPPEEEPAETFSEAGEGPEGKETPKVDTKRPIAPKPKYPYPSRRTIHGDTGMLPQVPGREEEPKEDEPSKRKPAAEHPPETPKVITDKQAPSAGAPKAGPPRNGRKSKKPSGLRVAAILVGLVLLVGGAGYFALSALWPEATQIQGEQLDFPGPGEGAVQVTIVTGDLGTDIGDKLVEAGVVKTTEGFKRAFDNNSASSTIKPGTYTLRKGMTSAAALAALLDEENRVDNAVTVNPGQTITQVKDKLVSVGGFSPAEVDEALADPSSFGLPEVAGGNAEGWLAAGSYDVGSASTVTTVLSEMVDRTTALLKSLDVPEDQWEEVLTKASILEREVISDDDRPKVARVIENRLADPGGETLGLLQMDSTVLYGVGKSGGIPTTDDLESDSPYNTYRAAGLPPTPIAAPSVESIEATLEPADGDWLYFVTINLDTGETRFSSTIEEQVENTQLLTQWCEENPGKC